MSRMRIGVLTGGGDAPGTNAVIRALVESLAHAGAAKVLGIQDGYLGLLERRTCRLDAGAVDALLAEGGTVLGTTNRVSPLDHEGRDRRMEAVENARAMGLDGVVAIGGDGTLTIAAALHAAGLPTVGVPKTIDNDIFGVERSFGFDTAVARATEALDELHTTARSHGRVMILQTMGRHAGWIALEAGIAGGAHVILLPELGFDLQAVVAACRRRESRRLHSLVCVAEGVAGAPQGTAFAEVLGAQLQPLLGCEVRTTVLGHVQRGGVPTASDRVLATRYGVAAAALVRTRLWGRMVTLVDGHTGQAVLQLAAGRTRSVPREHALLTCARSIGVSLGH